MLTRRSLATNKKVHEVFTGVLTSAIRLPRPAQKRPEPAERLFYLDPRTNIAAMQNQCTALPRAMQDKAPRSSGVNQE